MESARAVALVIGFSEYQSWLFRLALRENGYEAFEAADAFEAIGALEEHAPEAVLINARVPGLSAWELIAIFQKYRPASSYVVIGDPETLPAREHNLSRPDDYQSLSNDDLYWVATSTGLPS